MREDPDVRELVMLILQIFVKKRSTDLLNVTFSVIVRIKTGTKGSMILEFDQWVASCIIQEERTKDWTSGWC